MRLNFHCHFDIGSNEACQVLDNLSGNLSGVPIQTSRVEFHASEKASRLQRMSWLGNTTSFSSGNVLDAVVADEAAVSEEGAADGLSASICRKAISDLTSNADESTSNITWQLPRKPT